MAEKASSSMAVGSSSSFPGHQKDPGFNFTFNFTCPVSLPSTPEIAATRIAKNMASFGFSYLRFVYIVLFIVLIPNRKVSLVYLVGIREIWSLFLRAQLNNSFLPNYNKSICQRLFLFILFTVAAVAMILTESGIHLLIVLVATAPAILVHAVLRQKKDFGFVDSGEGAVFVCGGDYAAKMLAMEIAEDCGSSYSV